MPTRKTFEEINERIKYLRDHPVKSFIIKQAGTGVTSADIPDFTTKEISNYLIAASKKHMTVDQWMRFVLKEACEQL